MKKFQIALINRINYLCNEKNYSYYTLSYKAGMSLTTLMNITDGKTKNPGVFTIYRICTGLGISLHDFFNDKEFKELISEMEE